MIMRVVLCSSLRGASGQKNLFKGLYITTASIRSNKKNFAIGSFSASLKTRTYPERAIRVLGTPVAIQDSPLREHPKPRDTIFARVPKINASAIFFFFCCWQSLTIRIDNICPAIFHDTSSKWLDNLRL